MRYVFVFLASALLSSCASMPPTEQYLDPKTGATIVRIDAPFYLYRRVARVREVQVQFVQMAPVYINRAGKRRLFLWLEAPLEQAPASAEFQLDGNSLSLPLATVDRRSIGIGEHVYSRAAGFGASGYYEISPEQLARIAGATQLSLAVNEGKTTFSSSGENARAAASTRVLLQSLLSS